MCKMALLVWVVFALLAPTVATAQDSGPPLRATEDEPVSVSIDLASAYQASATTSVPADLPVRIELRNEGDEPHNFTVEELGVSIDVPDGSSRAIEFDSLSAGQYKFQCLGEGHELNDQPGTLVVSASAGQVPATTGTAQAFTVEFTPAGVSPQLLMLPENTPISLEITNNSAETHVFTVEALSIAINVAPGETVTQELSTGAAGSHPFTCATPGHVMELGLFQVGGFGTTLAGGGTGAESEGCAGMAVYRQQYEGVLMSAVYANPDVIEAYQRVQAAPIGTDFSENLTPEEMTALSDMYAALADGLVTITPPLFAVEWHEVQIRLMRLYSEAMLASATIGSDAAGLQYQDQIDAAINDETAARESGSALCPEFFGWTASA